MPQCSSCHFYRVLTQSTNHSLGTGECRRRPPISPPGSDNRFHPDVAIFPMVLETDWCGEFTTCTDALPSCCVDQANAAFDAASQHDPSETAAASDGSECNASQCSASRNAMRARD
jgi:hypothetical protein